MKQFTIESGKTTTKALGRTHEDAAIAAIKAAVDGENQHSLGPFMIVRRGGGFEASETGDSKRYSVRSVTRQLRRFGDIT